MSRKRALITGVRGQDGSYLAEHLLELGYEVTGMLPHRNGVDMSNLTMARKYPEFHTVSGDLTDAHSIDRVIRDLHPHEIYNLAAQSFVGRSWEMPGYTMDVNCTGFVHILESVIRHKLTGRTRIYQASTSEQFGKAPAPQSEETPFDPCSPYGVSKTAAHMIAKNYRESYGMHISCGILFNHESYRRPPHFLTQKVARGAAAIAKGKTDTLQLGCLDAKRDWGWAPDYVVAMQRMLQLEDCCDLVIGTGESHSVEHFVETAFRQLKLDYKQHVAIDQDLVRPVEVPELRADVMRARRLLNWEPEVRFYRLIELMVDNWMTDWS